MNLKRIIREELDNNLLMEGKLNDMFKKFNMTQIKKELKERLDIDETSTKMEVAKKLIKYSYKLELKLLKYELGAILGGFIFYFLSAVLDVAGVEPFVTDGEPKMPHFILWGAGALLNVIRMVRKDLKEEDGLEWIKDTNSNQDIAQDIADETKIKNGKLYPPFLSPAHTLPPNTSHVNHLFLPLPPYPLPHFTKYGKEQYGLNDVDVNDIWERYKKLIKNKVNNLNESNELEWIKDTKSNQDIAQEIADETKIKNNRLYHPLLPTYFFHLLFPHPPLFSPSLFTKYCKEQYGLTKGDIDDVWKRYKKLIENKVDNLNESNDLQWIKDVKSDEDIAQELVNNTKIVKDANGNFTIEADNFRPYPIEDFAYDYAPYFIVQMESNYGITDINHVSKIWKRYQEGIGVRTAKEYPIGGVNESNDFSWIDEIPQYDFYNGEYYIDISELDDDESCEVQQAILNIGIDWKDSMGLQKRFCDTRNTKGYIIKNATLYRTPRTFKEYEEAIYPDIIYINGRTDLLA